MLGGKLHMRRRNENNYATGRDPDSFDEKFGRLSLWQWGDTCIRLARLLRREYMENCYDAPRNQTLWPFKRSRTMLRTRLKIKLINEILFCDWPEIVKK